MRSSVPVLLLAITGLSACVDGTGAPITAAGGRSLTEQCAVRAARAVRMPVNELPVVQQLSYPEGDIITVDVPGQGKIRCQANVDGAIGELVWIEGGPAAAAPRPAAG